MGSLLLLVVLKWNLVFAFGVKVLIWCFFDYLSCWNTLCKNNFWIPSLGFVPSQSWNYCQFWGCSQIALESLFHSPMLSRSYSYIIHLCLILLLSFFNFVHLFSCISLTLTPILWLCAAPFSVFFVFSLCKNSCQTWCFWQKSLSSEGSDSLKVSPYLSLSVCSLFSHLVWTYRHSNTHTHTRALIQIITSFRWELWSHGRLAFFHPSIDSCSIFIIW